MKKLYIAILPVCLAFLSLCLCGCATVPFTGRSQMLIFSDTEVSSLSQQSYLDFMRTAQISSNQAYNAEVEAVGKRLTRALGTYLSKRPGQKTFSSMDWEFRVVQNSQVNAFCLPNGKIVFYEGILKYANNPDFIAVVMSHEIAHAIASHGNERMSQQFAVSAAATLVEGILSSNPSLSKKQAIFELAFGLGSTLGYILPYSRKHEYEADRIGLYLMALAGYDIYRAPVFWEKMSQSKSAAGVPQFLSTHPSDKNRIAQMKKQIPEAAKYLRK